MRNILAQHGQVPLVSVAAALELQLSTFATSSSIFTTAPTASSGFLAFSDTPLALLASDVPVPASPSPSSSTPISIDLTQRTSNESIAEYSFHNKGVAAAPNDCDSLMNKRGRQCFAGFLAAALGYISITGVVNHFSSRSGGEAEENAQWIASSNNWLDRQLCRWAGACGTLHLKQSAWTWDGLEDIKPPKLPDTSNFWTSGPEDPDSWSDEERTLREIPQYVFDYAPYVHLFSGEQFWPCDLAEHLVHTSPYVNYTKILNLKYDRNLTNLDELNDYEGSVHGRYMYLHSNDNVEERPNWLGGAKNIPTAPEITENEDMTWPNPEHQDTFNLKSAKQRAYAESARVDESAIEDGPWDWIWPTLSPSTNGRCGGNSGFTCEGSNFGQCCSIYGWCGRNEAYCGQACDPLAGQCKDPFEPDPKPHSELRRRKHDLESRRHQPTPAGKSSAPAILVVVPKDDGIVDAFWFFFYSFNLGNKVFNIRFGNHVGDWEHTMVRFRHGRPESAFVSEHDFGGAYAWQALEKYLPSPDGSGTMVGTWSNSTVAKLAIRPVVYSAIGTHAMYPTPGLHPYILPWGILHDQTDRGPLWDPSLNVRSFTWDYKEKIVRSSTRNPTAPTEWFHYAGHWGDKYYPLSDPRQYRFAGQYHYVNGPTGPRFKNLGREKVCQGERPCKIRNWVGDKRVKRVPPPGHSSEPGGLPGGNSTDEVTTPTGEHFVWPTIE